MRINSKTTFRTTLLQIFGAAVVSLVGFFTMDQILFGEVPCVVQSCKINFCETDHHDEHQKIYACSKQVVIPQHVAILPTKILNKNFIQQLFWPPNWHPKKINNTIFSCLDCKKTIELLI